MSLVNYFILSISCITAGVLAGAIPGTISNQKCYEYLNIQDVPAVQPLTREELKTIITDESVNAPPIAAFAGGNNAKPIELPFMTREELKNILTDESVNAPPIAAFAGGKNAKPKELPFMAALGYDDGVGKKFNCGGNLISEQFVLTAAHCVYSIVWGYVKYVRLGDLNLTSTTDDNNAQEFTVIQYEVHPSYLYPKKYHDIALLKLDTPAIFTDYVRPVCLEPKRATLRSAIFYGAGWGALGFGEEASDHLQIGNLFHTPRETCKEIFGRDSTLPNGIVDDFQFCAGSTYKVADTCEGDSGGPLVYRKTYPHIISYLAGITSFGKACAISSVPGVYTRVSSYIDWIEKIVWPITANQRNIYDSLAFF